MNSMPAGLGMLTVARCERGMPKKWNEPGKWIWSKELVHQPLIDTETFEQAQALQRAKTSGQTVPGLADRPKQTRQRGALDCQDAPLVKAGHASAVNVIIGPWRSLVNLEPDAVTA
jgi:hypothetical protein